MNNSHTVVTYTSWGQRLQQSCCGVVFGLLLFLASFPFLVWNEGRSIARYQSLEEGKKSVVVVADPTDAVDRSREGALVYVSGKALAGSSSVASDPTFAVSPFETLKLKRVAEMYQWEENSSSHTTKTEGGGTRTETTYSYDKTWSDHLINAGSFSDASYQNPSSMPYSTQEYAASPITVGSYTLSSGLVNKINWFSDLHNDGSLSVGNITEDDGQHQAMVYGTGFYLGASPNAPNVGDMKISFQYIPEGTVSLVAAQTGATFSPYATKRGGSLLLLRGGHHTADDLLSLAQRDNAVVTWLVRLAGFLAMFLGLRTVSKPLEVVLDRIPVVGRCAGDLADGATGVVNCIVAAALSVVTIALAWLAYRPAFACLLLAAVGGLIYVTKTKADTGRHGRATCDIPTVHATAIYAGVPAKDNGFA